MRFLLLAAIVMSACVVNAQAPYQCLLPGIKQYFTNDRHYLRGMRIDSVSTRGNAAVLHPFRTRRVRNGYQVDSAGGSWLGKEARLFPGGRTEFQTYWDDTVVIETLADSGDSWIFYSDTSSLYYVATVTAIDSMTIRGKSDSVKTISLSAMRNGTPVSSNPISSYRILLSRDHGFQEIFDLYTFPYTKPGGAAFPGPFDHFLSTNPYQLPAASIFRPIEYRNPLYSELYDFEPGDMFQRGRTREEVSVNGFTEIQVVQDSIGSRSRVPGGLQYSCVSRGYARITNTSPYKIISEGYSGPGTTTRFYPDLPVMILDTAIMPEEGMQRSVYYYNPSDSTRCFASASYKRQGYKFPVPLDGPPDESASYKVGFGLTDSAGGYWHNTSGFFSYYRQSLSARKAGVPCGTFVALNVGATLVSNKQRIYPNPASDLFNVDLEDASPETTVTITDIAGRSLLQTTLRPGRNAIRVKELPDGIYLVRLSNGVITHTERLIVSH